MKNSHDNYLHIAIVLKIIMGCDNMWTLERDKSKEVIWLAWWLKEKGKEEVVFLNLSH